MIELRIYNREIHNKQSATALLWTNHAYKLEEHRRHYMHSYFFTQNIAYTSGTEATPSV